MLKDLIRSQQKKGYALPVLDEGILLATKRDSQGRARDCFHPSEISGDYFCPRAWLLGQRNPDLYNNVEFDVQTLWRFSVGTQLHELVQSILSESDCALFGAWKCTRWCKEKRCKALGFKPEDTYCPEGTPHKAKWEYNEVRVIDDELEIRGRTDGILLLPDGKYIFEFKTTNSRIFNTMVEPLDHHTEQAMWYLDILSRSSHFEQELLALQEDGIDVADALRIARLPFKGMVILYMNKDTQEFREFMVKNDGALRMPSSINILGMDISWEDDALSEKKEILRETLQYRDAGELCPRYDVCVNKSSSRARRCFAKTACFEED